MKNISKWATAGVVMISGCAEASHSTDEVVVEEGICQLHINHGAANYVGFSLSLELGHKSRFDAQKISDSVLAVMKFESGDSINIWDDNADGSPDRLNFYEADGQLDMIIDLEAEYLEAENSTHPWYVYNIKQLYRNRFRHWEYGCKRIGSS